MFSGDIFRCKNTNEKLDKVKRSLLVCRRCWARLWPAGTTATLVSRMTTPPGPLLSPALARQCWKAPAQFLAFSLVSAGDTPFYSQMRSAGFLFPKCLPLQMLKFIDIHVPMWLKFITSERRGKFGEKKNARIFQKCIWMRICWLPSLWEKWDGVACLCCAGCSALMVIQTYLKDNPSESVMCVVKVG